MLTYEEALQEVVAATAPLKPVTMFLPEAAGQVLASPAKALWDMPSFDNSAMDGFAFNFLADKNNQAFTIIGASYAGHPFPGSVKPGEAVRITTGAILPKGADTVVPIEDAEEQGNQVVFNSLPQAGQHVRYAGEEYRAGEILAAPGTPLKAGEVALLASAGVEQLDVYPRPRVAVLATGDELVELGQTPGPGQIINSNLLFLQTRLFECGCTPLCIGIGTDDQATLAQLIDRALDADLILTTGGVSVGEKDQVHATLARKDFQKIFWKVAIKPGKPVLFGKLAEIPFFGLPGNPAATAATFELFVRPALKRLAGYSNVLPSKRKAILTHDVKGGGNRQAFLWCSLEWQEDGYRVTAAQRQGSGQTRSLQGRNALLPVPTQVKTWHAGEAVEVLLLDDAPVSSRQVDLEG